MIHGLAICLALAAALAVFGLLALLIVGRLPAAKPRPNQPGSLGESDWPVIDDWERHVQSTPGVGELGETPIFEQLCVDLWDADLGSGGGDAA